MGGASSKNTEATSILLSTSNAAFLKSQGIHTESDHNRGMGGCLGCRLEDSCNCSYFQSQLTELDRKIVAVLAEKPGSSACSLLSFDGEDEVVKLMLATDKFVEGTEPSQLNVVYNEELHESCASNENFEEDYEEISRSNSADKEELKYYSSDEIEGSPDAVEKFSPLDDDEYFTPSPCSLRCIPAVEPKNQLTSMNDIYQEGSCVKWRNNKERVSALTNRTSDHLDILPIEFRLQIMDKLCKIRYIEIMLTVVEDIYYCAKGLSPEPIRGVWFNLEKTLQLCGKTAAKLCRPWLWIIYRVDRAAVKTLSSIF